VARATTMLERPSTDHPEKEYLLAAASAGEVNERGERPSYFKQRCVFLLALSQAIMTCRRAVVWIEARLTSWAKARVRA
jgi:hypothetical protein